MSPRASLSGRWLAVQAARRLTGEHTEIDKKVSVHRDIKFVVAIIKINSAVRGLATGDRLRKVPRRLF